MSPKMNVLEDECQARDHGHIILPSASDVKMKKRSSYSEKENWIDSCLGNMQKEANL